MSESLDFNFTELAALFGVSVPTIRTAIKEGAPGMNVRPTRGKSAKIHAPTFLQWWVERERNRVGDRERDLGSLAQRERQLDIEIKEEKVRRLRGEFVPRVAFSRVLREVTARLSIAIERLPEREAEGMLGLRDRVMATDALTAMMGQLRAELVNPERWVPPEDWFDEGDEVATRLL